MTIEIRKDGDKTCVRIEGRLDTVSSQDFERQVMPLYERPRPEVVIDCAELHYISSSGLRQFLMLQKGILAAEGTLTVRNMNPDIKEIFDITGFSNIFTIES